MSVKKNAPQEFWEEQQYMWRDPGQVATHWTGYSPVDPVIFEYFEEGDFFSVLDAFHITLLLTREYEHLVMAMTILNKTPVFSYLPLPHPSGIAIDLKRRAVHIASTRNPNVLFEFSPLNKVINRLDINTRGLKNYFSNVLLPRQTRFLAGCYYIHDLAMIGNTLYANSVGQNSIVKIDTNGASIVWWPICIEENKQPVFGQNHIQLNSIAAGRNIATSYFSASSDRISVRRPGHRNFPVDKRGVIFSGETREPIVFGLTRPHSARLYKRNLYVDNSGYGELIVVKNGEPIVLSKLPGWTRGLAFYKDIAFVGTSRVIPRFRQYAPGLNVDKSQCGIHAVDVKTGNILGSIYWPYGNQIFAIELVSQEMTQGFPTVIDNKNLSKEKKLYYTFS